MVGVTFNTIHNNIEKRLTEILTNLQIDDESSLSILTENQKLKNINKDNIKVKGKNKSSKEKTYNLSGYLLFCNQERENVKKQNPELSPKDIMRILGPMWKEQDDDIRKEFNDRAKAIKSDKVSFADYRKKIENTRQRKKDEVKARKLNK